MGKTALRLTSETITVGQYLTFERKSKRKHEFFNGEIVAMAGASLRHNIISSNLQGEIFAQTKNTACRPFASDMRVKAKESYFYPDLVVVCENPELEDEEEDSIINPRVIIEILSKSTKLKDRNLKFDSYLAIPSVTDYVLVEQNTMRIEHFCRHEPAWNVFLLTQPEDKLVLQSINCELTLAEIYATLDFSAKSRKSPN